MKVNTFWFKGYGLGFSFNSTGFDIVLLFFGLSVDF